MRQFIKHKLEQKRYRWMVTGCAGFIGSNLTEALLNSGQSVVGLDNFSTGYQHNLDLVREAVGEENWGRFKFIHGDIISFETCRRSVLKVDFILHQAALGSVPRSIENPVQTNENNVTGFVNMLEAARLEKVKRFVYAASSSTYGDNLELPKKEENIGRPLSPYAVTKYVNELYAGVFASTYGMETIGLRYFNVFGRRQDPKGAYAAVIPLWFAALMQDTELFINGDGKTSRDFCYIDNCVQANILACLSEDERAVNQVYNVACGEKTSLNELFSMIRTRVSERIPAAANKEPVYREFRPGDVRHSLADISKAVQLLGYSPEYSIRKGLDRAAEWYMENLIAN